MSGQQIDLEGKQVSELENKIQNCVKQAVKKTSAATVYPGIYFTVSITDKDLEKMDESLETSIKRRNFVAKKMRLRGTPALSVNQEGLAFQDDLELFMAVLFSTGDECMSREAYDAVMGKEEVTA